VDNPKAIDYEFSGGTVVLHAVHTPYDDNGSLLQETLREPFEPGDSLEN